MKLDTFEDVTSWITMSYRLFGIRNFEKPENRWKRILIWIYSVLLLLTCTTFMSILQLENANSDFGPVERISYNVLSVVYILHYVLIAILSIYHSKGLLMIRKQIAEIEDRFRKWDVQFHYRRLYLRQNILAVFWFAVDITAHIVYTKLLIEGRIDIITYIGLVSCSYGSNVASLTVLDFTVHAYWLGLRFKQTNELLKWFIEKNHRIRAMNSKDDNYNEITTYAHQRRPTGRHRWFHSESFRNQIQVFSVNQVSSFERDSQYVKKMHLLQDIRYLHLRLCCVSKNLNKVFDTQIMVYITMVIIYFTVILYYVYMLINSGLVYDYSLAAILTSVLNVALTFTKIVIGTITCEYTCKMADDITETIHACSLYEIDNEMKDEITQFALQISHIQGRSSKYNFFRLSFTTIRGCISVVTTYLVIMIQWRQGIDEGYSNPLKNQTLTV